MSRSKAAGTRYESACRDFINAWCPDARCERVVLHGSRDQGDLRFHVDDLVVCGECKWRKRYPGDAELDEFWRQAEAETANSGADVGVLFVNRHGLGVSRTEVWMRVDWFAAIYGCQDHEFPPLGGHDPTDWVCMHMTEFLTLCYGQPAEKE